MAHSGPFQPGDRVQLTDSKNRHLTLELKEGAVKHNHKGAINHDDIIGQPEGTTVDSSAGGKYVVFRHLIPDYVLSMERKAQVIYPKDTAQILVEGDIFPGAKVLEAGAGSGGLSISLLRAIGDTGKLYSYDVRKDHLENAQKNVETYMGKKPENWHLRLGDLKEVTQEDTEGPVDRIVLDMLEPWECLDTARELLLPGGVLVVYVPTVPQMMKVMEGIRERGYFTEPRAWESLIRGWKVEGLATRPEHRMNAHTAFLIMTRRLADGVTAPKPQRKIQK